MDERPIGVFDSGVGGLTVLSQLIKFLPNEKFIYIADEAFVPYGTKSYEEIDNRVVKVAQFLQSQNVKAIVIACNTASVHFESIKKAVDVPILGVIAPACEMACNLSQGKRIGVIATRATVDSNCYNSLLQKQGAMSFSIECSDFVHLVECNLIDTLTSFQTVQNKLRAFTTFEIDTLILGCTHFDFLLGDISKVLGNINYVQCGLPVCLKLKEKLSQANLLSIGSGNVEIMTTSLCNKLTFFCKKLFLPCEGISFVKI